MPAALSRYRLDQRAGSPVLSSRFICPAGRIPELRRALQPADRISLSVLVAPTVPALSILRRLFAADTRLELASTEAGPGHLAPGAAVAPVERSAATPRFFEVSLSAGLATELDRMAAQGWSAKVRCGGVRAEAFPPPDALTDFLRAAVSRGVPFKATAGLHHAVSHHDQRTGFVHFGFLNLLLAVHRTHGSAAPAEVTEVLVSRDGTALADEARSMTEREAIQVRRSFLSYGSCSTSAPVADLEQLGLLPDPSAAPAQPES